MESFEQKKNPEFKIETHKISEGNEISYCKEHGGLLGIKIQDVELLYLDDDTFKDVDKKVRGGVPILFPNAGPIPEELKTEALKNLKQHGFVRDSELVWEKTASGFRTTLNSNEETKKVYPYDYNFEIEGKFEENGSFTITQTVENLEKEKEMPISSGLHPYFKISSEEKKNIKFNFEGGKIIEEQIEKWMNGKFVLIDNPNIPMEVFIPHIGTLVFTFSKEYKKVVVWSEEGKDFVCIEPFMREAGGIVSNPEIIKPSEKNIATVNILLKK